MAHARNEITISTVGDYITFDHAAALLGVPYMTLDARMRRHGWPIILINGVRLVRREDLPKLRALGR